MALRAAVGLLKDPDVKLVPGPRNQCSADIRPRTAGAATPRWVNYSTGPTPLQRPHAAPAQVASRGEQLRLNRGPELRSALAARWPW